MSDSWPKIWGTNIKIYANDLNSINILRIKKGGTCSLHSHITKHNIFHVISGKLKIECGELGHSVIGKDQSFTVLAGTTHRFQALEDTVAVEVMCVKYREDDIQRVDVGSIQNIDKVE